MNIRAKLTVTFFSLVIVVLTIISVLIYFFSSNYRQQDFYRRLKNRAINTSRVLMEVEEVNAELLRRMERNNPASLPNQYILIYNYKNQELYSSESSNIIPVDSALLTKIRLRREIKFTHENYEVLGFLFADSYDRFTIIAAATDVYGLDALRNLRNVLMVTFGVSLVIVSILGWFYAGKVLSPISRIVAEVSKITEANLSQRLDEGNKTDELSKLSQTFNRMLERLQGAFVSQKNFIANASHEIKTPITVMAGEIEVALLHERGREYYVNTLRSVLGGLRNMNKLSTQLLLLAQTSADEPEKNFSLIRIDDILWELQEELQKAHPHYQIFIHFDIKIDYDSLVLNADEQLIKVALLNLMDNACKYSDDSRVNIDLSLKDRHQISLAFINTGPGIEPAISEKIFNPFVRGKNSKKVKGFGIGLSLVTRIVSLHDGVLTVESVPQQLTKFTVVLPLHRQ
ncbi:MAG TPA: ATP-binding protein [Chryseosolibacter sp.]|nr:ATP-binding protein [Chryseosolibacter sp.]